MEEQQFNPERVGRSLTRLRAAKKKKKQSRLDSFFTTKPSPSKPPGDTVADKFQAGWPWAVKSLSCTPVYFQYTITKEIHRAVHE